MGANGRAHAYALGCATSGRWHAMLLLGYGRDPHGHAHWRAAQRAGRAHLHLWVAVAGACLAGAARACHRAEPVEPSEAKYRQPPSWQATKALACRHNVLWVCAWAWGPG